MRIAVFRWFSYLLLPLLLLTWAGIGLYQAQKRLPPGLHISGTWRAVSAQDVHLLYDLAWADASGAPLVSQQIDAELLRRVAQAREFILIDTGLFGDYPAAGPLADGLRTPRPVAAPLVDALLQAKLDHPTLQVLVLVDPTSAQLSADPQPHRRLIEAGIAVVAVDVNRLRAANPVFSGLWHLCCQWWSGTAVDGLWPNPLGLGPAQVSFGLWGRTQGLERSHRQLMVSDDGNGALGAMVVSRALNEEAALHSATALTLTGAALEPILESEYTVAQFSGWSGGAMQARSQRLLERARTAPAPPASAGARARVLTEAAIAESLVARIDATRAGDGVDVAALYLSQRDLIRALLDAARRGVAVRVLLDPCKDGYGYERSGMPNREVATELVASSEGNVRVRWYRTHGEQFSPGLVLVRGAGSDWLMVGTAALSRRDLDDINLAAAFVVELPAQSTATVDAQSWFDTLWLNRAAGGIEYTSDADVYADASQLRYWQYRLLEAAGAAFY